MTTRSTRTTEPGIASPMSREAERLLVALLKIASDTGYYYAKRKDVVASLGLPPRARITAAYRELQDWGQVCDYRGQESIMRGCVVALPTASPERTVLDEAATDDRLTGLPFRALRALVAFGATREPLGSHQELAWHLGVAVDDVVDVVRYLEHLGYFTRWYGGGPTGDYVVRLTARRDV